MKNLFGQTNLNNPNNFPATSSFATNNIFGGSNIPNAFNLSANAPNFSSMTRMSTFSTMNSPNINFSTINVPNFNVLNQNSNFGNFNNPTSSIGGMNIPNNSSNPFSKNSGDVNTPLNTNNNFENKFSSWKTTTNQQQIPLQSWNRQTNTLSNWLNPLTRKSAQPLSNCNNRNNFSNWNKPTNYSFGLPNTFGSQSPQKPWTPLWDNTQSTISFFQPTKPGFAPVQSNINGSSFDFLLTSEEESGEVNNKKQQVVTNFQTILAMPEYSGKSLEEIRYEDYAANRRGNSPFAFGAMTSFTFGVNNASNTLDFGLQTRSTSVNPNLGVGLGFSTANTGGLAPINTSGFGGGINNALLGQGVSSNSNHLGIAPTNNFFGQEVQLNNNFWQPLNAARGTNNSFGQNVSTTGGFGQISQLFPLTSNTMGQTLSNWNTPHKKTSNKNKINNFSNRNKPTNYSFGLPKTFGSQSPQKPWTPFWDNTQSTISFFQPTKPGFAPVQSNINGSSLDFRLTSVEEFAMLNNKKQQVVTNFQTILAMPEYSGKSLEEIRYEDYAANRRGNFPFAGGTMTSSAFGVNNASNILDFGLQTGNTVSRKCS